MQLLKNNKDSGFCNASVQKNWVSLILRVSAISSAERELWVCEVPSWCWNQRNLSSAAPCCCVEIKQAADEHVAVLVDIVGKNGTFSNIPWFTWCNGENDTPCQYVFFQDSDLDGAFRCTGWTIVANKKNYTIFLVMLKHAETTYQHYISSCSLLQLQTRISHLRRSLKYIHCPFQLARETQTAELLSEIHAFLKTFCISKLPSSVNLRIFVQTGLREGCSPFGWLKTVTSLCQLHKWSSTKKNDLIRIKECSVFCLFKKHIAHANKYAFLWLQDVVPSVDAQ